MEHVFIIPGWYPHLPCHPFEGLFIREQAEALAQLRPHRRFTLSLWDQGRGVVSLGHLLKSRSCVLRPLEARPTERALATNLVEQRTPARSWNPRYLGGNRAAILAANRTNLERATARWGPPDVIHAHVSYPAGWVAMHLGRERSIPYVVTEHMGPFPLPYYRTRDGTLNPLLRAPLEAADACIAVSPALATAIESFGLPRPRYIPNVVDETKYRATAARVGEPFTFLTMSAMERPKGILDLLHAVAKLLPRIEPGERERIRFRIVGERLAAREFREAAGELGLARWVQWSDLLPRDQARARFEESDCYVLPSHHESFGIVLVEALASGRPLIATRCGGPEAIVNDANGLLVDVGDTEGLARALETMLRRARTYDPQALRAEFMARYSRPAVVGALDSVYEQVLATRGHSSGLG